MSDSTLCGAPETGKVDRKSGVDFNNGYFTHCSTPPLTELIGVWWGIARHRRLVYKGKILLNQYR